MREIVRFAKAEALPTLEEVLGAEDLPAEDALAPRLRRLVDEALATYVALVEPRDDFPSRPLFEELLREGHLLIAAHTRKHRREQIRFGSPVIERAPLGRWREEGETTLGQRASREVERLVAAWAPSRVPDEAKRALRERMGHAARAAGMGELPMVDA